jgi:twinkle protein
MAEFVQHEECPKCGSKDNLARYDDNSAYCFGCEYFEKSDGEPMVASSVTKPKGAFNPIRGDYQDLPDRKLFEKTLRKFGYKFGTTSDGTPCHIAPLYNNKGQLVAQKLRMPGKDFRVVGSLDDACLFGENVYESGGKRLVITEGEIDCLSYAQASGLTWPVVSVPNGAQSAAKAIRRSLSYVESFEEVVFLFDQDKPGRNAARECADLLPPGKAKIATTSLKDPNEMLKAGLVGELKSAVYEAKSHRPDGVVDGSDIDLSMLQTVTPRGLSIPYKELNDAIHGLRQRELVMVCAGSGIGKSTLVKELGFHLTTAHNAKVGYICLEESLAKTAQSLVALDNGVPIGNLMEEPSLLTDDQWKESYDKAVAPSVFYDAFGSTDVDNIISRMRYLAVGAQCQFIVLDHVSMVVSGLDVDERKTLDVLMTRIRSEVCEQTNVGVIAVSHLRRNSGKESFNEGGTVSVTDLRGSAAIEQLSDIVLAAERDQQSGENSSRTTLRLLKNRPFGQVGIVGHCEYQSLTGRLVPVDADAKPSATTEEGEQPFTF